MKLNMDEARRREARGRYDFYSQRDLPDALADIDALLERLKGLLLAAEEHKPCSQVNAHLHAEMERSRKLLKGQGDETLSAHDTPHYHD